MRYLITGGAGFIGGHLSKALVEKQGAHPTDIQIIDNLSTGSPSNILQGALFGADDIKHCNWKHLFELKPDVVFHLAAAVGVRKILQDPLGTIETNLEGTKRLLEAVVALPVDRRPTIVLASTSEVYGKNDKWALTEEDDRITGSTSKSRWVYAETKAMDEFLVNIYAKEYDLKIIICRFFSVVGPRQVPQYGMVLPSFVRQALSGRALTVYGDGTQIRSFLHVEDCVKMVLNLLPFAKAGEPLTMNIGNPDPVMIRDLAWRVRHWAKSQSEIAYIPYKQAYGDGFEDMMRRVPDMSKYKELMNLPDLSLKSLDRIITDTIDWVREDEEVSSN